MTWHASPSILSAAGLVAVSLAIAETEGWTALGPTPNANVIALATSSSGLFAGTNGSGLVVSRDAGSNWVAARNGFAATVVYALAIDPANASIVYAGTNGHAVLKSTDGGTTWNSASQGIEGVSVTALAIDPRSPSLLYAGSAANGLFKSPDGGASWVAGGLDASGGAVSSLAVDALAMDPNILGRVYAGTPAGGVFERTFPSAVQRVPLHRSHPPVTVGFRPFP